MTAEEEEPAGPANAQSEEAGRLAGGHNVLTAACQSLL